MRLRDLLKSNYDRIAENTTKYYLELKNNYGARFGDELSLLATAGVLDAQAYVLIEHSVEIDAIVEMAREAVSPKELSTYRRLRTQELMSHKSIKSITRFFEGEDLTSDPLFNFVFSLEVALFEVDTPLSISSIELACFEARSSIADAVRRTMETYVSEGLFASAATTFMESSEFREARRRLRIGP